MGLTRPRNKEELPVGEGGGSGLSGGDWDTGFIALNGIGVRMISLVCKKITPV